MAYDALHSQVVMFGLSVPFASGFPGPTNFDQRTWLWNGFTWANQYPNPSPPIRTGAVMAYDSINQKTVLFGGGTTSAALNDTWVWDGSTWTNLNPANPPPGRFNAVMAYDTLHGQFVLFGGQDFFNPYFADTWVYDLSTNTWTQKSTPAGAPYSPYPPAPTAGRIWSSMVYDESMQKIVLFGGYGYGNLTLGDTWTWDGTAWALAATTGPAPRSAQMMAYDPGQQHVVLFGGADTNSHYLNDTWILDGSGWTQATPANQPTARSQGAMSYDGVNQKVILVGGFALPSGTWNSETWLYGGIGTAQTAVTVNVPSNVQFTFNGTTYTGAQTINVAPGTYTLSTASPQVTANDTRAVFVSWSDGGAQSHQVTVGSSALSIIGNFQIQYMLRTSVAPAGGGSITPAAGFYNQGSPLTFTVAPASGYAFAGWFGACSGMGACSFSLNGPATVGAYFTYLEVRVPNGNQFTVNGVSYWNTVRLAAGPGTYMITATTPLTPFLGFPDRASIFAFWIIGSDPTRLTQNPIQVTVGTSPVSVVGAFQDLGRISASAVPSNGGSVSLSPPSADGFYLPFGTQVTVTATPNAGFIFDSWSGACTGAGPCVLTSGGSVQVAVAHFSRPENWVQLFPNRSPQKRNDAAMAYDPVNQNIVLFGGEQGKPGTGGAVFGDTWIWNGANWSRQHPLLSPSPRWGAMMTYDAARHQMVLYGGRPDSSPSPSIGLSETWVWDFANNTWKLASSVGPPRYEGSMIYDPQSTKVILFGGAAGPQNETWAWDGISWTKLNVTASPSPRVSAGIAYNAATNRVLLFGGGTTLNNGGEQGKSVSDTWEWDGATWTLQKPLQIPPALATPTMAYDPVALQIIMLESGGTANTPMQTWAWDGSTWFPRAPVSMPPGRDRQSMVYDATRGEIVLFGGVNLATNTPYGDTWVWLVPAVNLVPQQPTVTREGSGHYVVAVPLANMGNVPVTNVIVSSAMLGPASGGGATINLIDRGTAGSFSFKVKVSDVPGTSATVSLQGTFNADGVAAIPWSATFLVNLP